MFESLSPFKQGKSAYFVQLDYPVTGFYHMNETVVTFWEALPGKILLSVFLGGHLTWWSSPPPASWAVRWAS